MTESLWYCYSDGGFFMTPVTLSLVLCFLNGQPADAPATFPEQPLKAALAQAKEQDKLIVAEFWTYHGEPSHSYAEKTLSTPAVRTWLGNHAAGCRINFNFNRSLRTRFHVIETPTVLLLDTKLQIWAKLKGAHPPEKVVEKLEEGRRIREAFLEAQKAIAGNPQDAAVHLALTRGYIQMGNPESAEKALREFHRLDPLGTIGCHEKLAFDIGYIHHLRRRDSEAERLYRLSAEWARTGRKDIRASVLYFLASLQMRSDQYDKAIAVLELLLDEFKKLPESSEEIFVPHRSEVLYVLALQYMQHTKTPEKGKKMLETIAEQYAGRFAEAAEHYLRHIEMEGLEGVRKKR